MLQILARTFGIAARTDKIADRRESRFPQPSRDWPPFGAVPEPGPDWPAPPHWYQRRDAPSCRD